MDPDQNRTGKAPWQTVAADAVQQLICAFVSGQTKNLKASGLPQLQQTRFAGSELILDAGVDKTCVVKIFRIVTDDIVDLGVHHL